MPFGVSNFQYIRDFTLAIGSMFIGSQCMHLYLRPELTVGSETFDAEHDERRKAIKQVQEKSNFNLNDENDEAIFLSPFSSTKNKNNYKYKYKHLNSNSQKQNQNHENNGFSAKFNLEPTGKFNIQTAYEDENQNKLSFIADGDTNAVILPNIITKSGDQNLNYNLVYKKKLLQPNVVEDDLDPSLLLEMGNEGYGAKLQIEKRNVFNLNENSKMRLRVGAKGTNYGVEPNVEVGIFPGSILGDENDSTSGKFVARLSQVNDDSLLNYGWEDKVLGD